MFAVLTVQKYTSEEQTRLVFGCIEPAERVGGILAECGYSVWPETMPIAPIRPDEERIRAEQLIRLALAPVEGTA